jgi:hypothetical protein
MKKNTLTLGLFVLCSTFIFAQEAAKPEEKKEGWFRTASIGFDAGQLAMINPRVGSGSNRINLGGAANFALNFKKGRHAWDNALAGIFAVQKLGSGNVVISNKTVAQPFQKTTDEFRFNTKYGYGIKEGGKLFIAADASLLTQFSPTFTDNNYITDINKQGLGDVKSQFLSPGIITLALGLDYKPTKKLSLFYAPVSFRGVVVQEQEIAKREAKAGSKLNAFGVAIDKKSNFNLGSLARVIYNDKFMSDKIVFNSNLGLFGAYSSGEGVKVDWANQVAWALGKGFQLGFNFNVFYDKKMYVQVSDKNGINGVKTDANNKPVLENNKVSAIQQLLFKYAKTF